MTKRSKMIIGAVLLLGIGYAIFWMINNSLSYQLREYGFSTKDIVHEEGYSFDDPSNRITKVLLLANESRLALIEMKKLPTWGWETTSGQVSTIERPEDGQYVLASHGNIKISWAKFYSESHLFATRYVDAIDPNVNGTVMPPLITGTQDMYLNVDYYTVNGRTLLFAHALSGKPSKGLSSTQVTDYIDSHLKK